MSTPVPPPRRPVIRLGVGWWACAGLIVVGLAWLVLQDHVLTGGLIVSGGFAVAAVLRGVLPEDRVGALRVRDRHVDVMMHALVALAVAAAVVLVHLREGS